MYSKVRILGDVGVEGSQFRGQRWCEFPGAKLAGISLSYWQWRSKVECPSNLLWRCPKTYLNRLLNWNYCFMARAILPTTQMEAPMTDLEDDVPTRKWEASTDVPTFPMDIFPGDFWRVSSQVSLADLALPQSFQSSCRGTSWHLHASQGCGVQRGAIRLTNLRGWMFVTRPWKNV
jgi:hypothetical protein